MPDQKKNDDGKTEQPDDGIRRDALGNVIEDGAPALDSEPDAEPEDNDTEEKAEETPPDLIPDPDEQPAEEVEDTTPFDDEKTDRVIDEIVAKEGDELLAVQDAASLKGGVKPPKRGFWRHKWIRRVLLLLLFAGVAAAAALPQSRYWILNTAGVRSSSSVTVVDSTTQLPLKGVSVSIGGKKIVTDSDGAAKFSELKLGPTKLVINQAGFEEVNRAIVVGWGSNPLGSFPLKATGIQYVIEVKDYLSDKPVEGVEATDGQVTAISGKDGKITLTMDSTVIIQDGVTLTKDGYRAEKITLNQDPKKPVRAALVLARKAVFVTKQSGKYDVYKSDIDGKNREVLLPGTGSENSNITLAVSPDGSRAALVSTRDNKRDSSGFLLSSIVLINTDNGEKLTIGEASQIQLIDWIGTRLIFQLGTSDSTAGNRYTVVSYNHSDNVRLQLAAANKLTAVMTAQGAVYYAVGADSANPSLQLGLFKIKPDGTGKQRVFEGELETVLRSAYNTFSLQANDGSWSSYDITSGAKSQIGSPSSLANHLYIDNAERSRSLWVGQGSLMSYAIPTGKDTAVKSQSGVAYPVFWLNNTVAVFRVSNAGETADYGIDVSGGAAHKISDVAASYGFAQSQ